MEKYEYDAEKIGQFAKMPKKLTIENKFDELAKKFHEDRGGNKESMQEILAAKEAYDQRQDPGLIEDLYEKMISRGMKGKNIDIEV